MRIVTGPVEYRSSPYHHAIADHAPGMVLFQHVPRRVGQLARAVYNTLMQQLQRSELAGWPVAVIVWGQYDPILIIDYRWSRHSDMALAVAGVEGERLLLNTAAQCKFFQEEQELSLADPAVLEQATAWLARVCIRALDDAGN